MVAKPELVQNGYGSAASQKWGGHRDRPRYRGEKKLIEQAYRLAEGMGIALWCEDEAGPFGSVASAPSKARLCQLGESPSPGSPGQAPGTECCGSVGNGTVEAYTGR